MQSRGVVVYTKGCIAIGDAIVRFVGGKGVPLFLLGVFCTGKTDSGFFEHLFRVGDGVGEKVVDVVVGKTEEIKPRLF